VTDIVTTNARSLLCSSFRRLSTAELVKPDSSATAIAPPSSLAVIPAKAGIHFAFRPALFLQVQGFHSAFGRAGNFLDFGHPALRGAAASCAVRAAPAAQCLCKESHQRNTPPVARSLGILPSDFASGLRGSLSARPCARSERTRILRAPLRAFPLPARHATGGPVSAASCRRSSSNSAHLLLMRQTSISANDHIDAVQGCTDSWMTGAVRGAEHRRRGGKMPGGSRRWIAAIAKQYMDVLSEQPRPAEKRRAVRFARCESDHRVRRLAFLVTFWAMPKSNPLPAGERKPLLLRPKKSQIKKKSEIKMDSRFRGNDELKNEGKSWIPACAGMTSERQTPSGAPP
jgi:hypothetical protein